MSHNPKVQEKRARENIIKEAERGQKSQKKHWLRITIASACRSERIEGKLSPKTLSLSPQGLDYVLQAFHNARKNRNVSFDIPAAFSGAQFHHQVQEILWGIGFKRDHKFLVV